MTVLIGNAVALVASLLMVLAGLVRKKNNILIVQTAQISAFVVSNLILGGISGAVVNAVSCVRNIFCYYGKLNTFAKAVIIILLSGLSLYFNTQGLIGLLPILSAVVFTAFMDIKDVFKFKVLIVLTSLPWLIYDLFIMSYSSAVFDFISIVANVQAMWKIQSLKAKKE